MQLQKRRGAEESLARLALTDGLTGLANRRRFDKQLDREWRLAGRDREALSLLMIDADDFKLYSDSYGHQRDDEVFVDRIDDRRQSLPKRRLLRAVRRRRVRRSLAADADRRRAGRRRTHPAGDRGCRRPARPKQRGKVGVCSVVPGRTDLHCALVAAADSALYEAKRRGRNQTSAAAGLTAPPAGRLAES